MYLSLEATLHDHFWNNEHGPGELALIESFLEKVTGPALEIGCGSGRLLLPLLEKGHQIEGLETSSDMIELLRLTAATKNLNPLIYHADASETLPMDTDYDAYLIPAFTIQLLSRTQTTDLFERLRYRGSNHPKLYFTTFIPWAEITGELEEDKWNIDKKATLPDHSSARCDTTHTIDRLNQTLVRNHRYSLTSENGQSTVTHHSQQTLRYYSLPELTSILTQTGWHIDQVITDLDPNSLNTDAHIITIQASSATRHPS